MQKTEAKAHLLDSGKCPVCQGTGWEMFTEKVEGYTEPIEFTRVCPKCKGSRRMSDKTGVPPEYCNADVSKFRFDTYKTSMEQTRKVFKNFIENFEKWQAWGKGLYLWSNTPGSGKTFLSCCLARSLMVKYDLQMRFITAPAYIDTVGESIKRARGEEDRSKVYKECDAVSYTHLTLPTN